MPLEAPALDTRTFEQLVADARRRIPLYTPEWTDFNDSDPGMTLVQLFAWLTELQLYNMNRLPELNYVKFLQLLGFDLAPARPAIAHLTVTTSPDASVVGPVPRGWQVSAQPPDGGPPLIFESDLGMDLVPVPLVSVQVFNGNDFTDVTPANDVDGTTFMPFGWTGQTGSALYLGFDGSKLPAGARPFPNEIRLRAFLPAGRPTDRDARRVGADDPPPPVELAWEYRPTASSRFWRHLNVFGDDSLAFTRNGDLQLEGPRHLDPTIEGKDERSLFWIRCRLVSGGYPGGRIPTLDFLLPNTVPVTNLATISNEILGASTGRPDQSFTLEQRPVSDLVLESQFVGGPPEPWVQVDDFLHSGRNDRHYVLHATRGEIVFGDGLLGQIPVDEAQIVAVSYRHGGGLAGNVGPRAINAPLTTPPGVKEVTNFRSAAGGLDEQSVDDLKKQAPEAIRSRDRAVSAGDFATHARQVGVLNAVAVPLMHPAFPGIEVPGAVTVAIVPDEPDQPPMPSAELLSVVSRELESRRLLTTEVFVRAPTYLAIRVEARVSATAYAALDDVQRQVMGAIDALLDPRTRAFGEDLHPSALYRAILAVPDVQAVDHLRIFNGDRELEDLGAPIVVPRDGIVYSAPGHEIAVVRSQDR
jgi:hypothetical protein